MRNDEKETERSGADMKGLLRFQIGMLGHASTLECPLAQTSSRLNNSFEELKRGKLFYTK